MRNRYRQSRFGLVVVLLALMQVVGCEKEQAFSTSDFVGKWQSSRMSMPIYLNEHDGWEILDDNGDTAQYGVWMYKERDRTIEWVFKSSSNITLDVNTVLSVTPDEFTLREQDGTVTTFRRIP